MTSVPVIQADKINAFYNELDARAPEIQKMLPSHISIDNFVRVTKTALQLQPDLLATTPRDFFNEVMRCANDGLIPDGKEAVFVIFNRNIANKKKGETDNWVKQAQYQPTTKGLVKLARNGGEVENVKTEVVYENDEFEVDLGEDKMVHKMPPKLGARGKPIGVYAIVKLKNGEEIREIMNLDQINAVKSMSKSQNIWDGAFGTEMWRKAVLKRALKYAPSSKDKLLERALDTDNRFYNLPAIEHVPVQAMTIEDKRSESLNIVAAKLAPPKKEEPVKVEKPKQNSAPNVEPMPTVETVEEEDVIVDIPFDPIMG